MQQGKCGFCGRSMMKAPLVRARGLGFCCNSCCRAYLALYPAGKKEGGKPIKGEPIKGKSVAGKQRKAARKGKSRRKKWKT